MLYTDSSAKHMLVIRNGHMYIFDAIDRDGKKEYFVFPFCICVKDSHNNGYIF